MSAGRLVERCIGNAPCGRPYAVATAGYTFAMLLLLTILLALTLLVASESDQPDDR